jgi:hypothetical protein
MEKKIDRCLRGSVALDGSRQTQMKWAQELDGEGSSAKAAGNRCRGRIVLSTSIPDTVPELSLGSVDKQRQ